MENYQLFNVSGMVTLRRDLVSGIAFAMLPDRGPISVDARFDWDKLELPIEELEKGKTAVVMFMANIAPNREPEVLLSQISSELGGPDLKDEPALHDMINELLSKL